MKQIFQDLKSGETLILDVPVPKLPDKHLKITSECSLVSSGTERMIVDFSKANYINKARKQPEKVKQVIQKIKTDGLITTLETVQARLNEIQPLGYSNVGIISEVGKGIEGFKIGDRVVSNGRHAEVVIAPEKLCAKIPENVSNEIASFTIVASIALQGVRLAKPTLGETVVVFGLGLIGNITCQLLKIHGCNVIGFDNSSDRVNSLKQLGFKAYHSGNTNVKDVIKNEFGEEFADASIITASAKQDELIKNSAECLRKRGRIILVGICDLNLDRADFYKKELSFQVSCSYGPGRYDRDYEDLGHDYPVAFVRWTENRNFKAILNLMKENLINFDGLIQQKVKIENSFSLYEKITKGLIITGLIQYNISKKIVSNISRMNGNNFNRTNSNICVAVLGAGLFTKSRILPSLKKINITPKWISSLNGVSSASASRNFQIEYNTTDVENIFNDKKVSTIFITTNHNSHYELALKGMEKGKNIYIEKPMCCSIKELESLIEAKKTSISNITVGFNRRFSPFVKPLKEYLIKKNVPISINFNINAGYIPLDHWVHDRKIGGGRIIGEVCHFVDLCQYLAGSRVVKVCTFSSSASLIGDSELSDVVNINLSFKNGSIASICYYSNGSKSFPKEIINVYSGNSVSVITNFSLLQSYGDGPNKKDDFIFKKQNKGHYESIKYFVDNQFKSEHIPFKDLVNTTAATILSAKSAIDNKSIDIPDEFI